MDQNILDAIQKSLPAMQMDALKKELEKAGHYDKLILQLSECQKENSGLRYERDSLKKLESEMRTEKEKAQLIQKDFELKRLQHEVDSAKLVAKEIKDLAMAAFRNPTITKSFNRNIPLKNSEYSAGSSLYETASETETRD